MEGNLTQFSDKAPMHILMLTRQVDEKGGLHGFTHTWVTALAERVEKLDVITQDFGKATLPSNVTIMSLGKERGASKIQQWFNFQRYLSHSARNADLIFAHMRPRYVLASSPVAFLNRVPTVLWYTLGHVDIQLKIAHRSVKRVVSATLDSIPIQSEKIIPIGHGIDFTRFVPPLNLPEQPRIVLAVGSLTPWKGIETLIEVAAQVTAQPGFEDVQFIWVGGEATITPPGYSEIVSRKINDFGLADRFKLTGMVPFSDMVGYYEQARVAVSLSDTGSTDKTVLEGIGCGIPTLATGTVFSDVLYDLPRCLARRRDVDDIAQKLMVLLSLPATERRELAMAQRRLAVDAHDLQGMMDRLVVVFKEILANNQF